MKREDVVKGLQMTLGLVRQERAGIQQTMEAALREAIALLATPQGAEVEAARDYVRGIFMLAKTDAALVGLAENDPGLAVEHEKAAHMIASVLDRALDALAREPATEAVLHRKNIHIATLEARLDRVASLRDHWRSVVETMTGVESCAVEVAQLRLRIDEVTRALEEVDHG